MNFWKNCSVVGDETRTFLNNILPGIRAEARNAAREECKKWQNCGSVETVRMTADAPEPKEGWLYKTWMGAKIGNGTLMRACSINGTSHFESTRISGVPRICAYLLTREPATLDDLSIELAGKRCWVYYDGEAVFIKRDGHNTNWCVGSKIRDDYDIALDMAKKLGAPIISRDQWTELTKHEQ